MKIQVEELLNSKIFVKENSAVNFKSPKSYLTPFLDIVGPHATDIRAEIDSPVINAEESGKQNIAYPRVNVEATIGDQMTGFYSVMGFIFALNTSTPVMKVYSGQSVRACLNLTIFNAEDIFEQNLLGNSNEIYNRAQVFFQKKNQQIEEYGKIYKDLTQKMLTPQGLNDLMGKLLLKGTQSRLGTSPVVGAAKLLLDAKTTYYTHPGDDFRCSEWNVYNAVTQNITDKEDAVSKPNKTIELAKIIMESN